MSNNNWKMPEPVFQRTSGSLPADFAARISNPVVPEPPAAVPDPTDEILSTLYAPPEETTEQPVTEQPAPTVAQTQAIEAQPIISEQFSAAEIDSVTRDAPVSAVKKGSGSRSIFIAIGLIVLLAVAAGFIALVYFLFLRIPPESTF